MKVDPRRIAPVLIAGVLATIYVIASPPSGDLAAHLLRAKLFSSQGIGVWNNWWYAGHHTPSYSILFPVAASALTPQLAAGIATTGTAALFEPLARGRFGPRAWLGSAWFGAATATSLFTGRLAFAFGLLPAIGAALALARGRGWIAAGLGALAALCSPLAALFAALVGASCVVGELLAGRRASSPAGRGERGERPRASLGLGVALASLAPIFLLAIAFPEGGTEPFTIATLWPIPVIGAALLIALPADAWALRAGVLLYSTGSVLAYAIPSPVGSNAARLGSLLAGPLAALVWWRRRPALLLLAALPLLYLQWQAPVRDVRTASDDTSVSAGYYAPVTAFFRRQPGPPFRVEIPFTQFHSEAYQIAQRLPIARGWERQLDIEYNRLFYGGALSAATYHAWLRELAVRFVSVSDAPLDYSARNEAALIARGLPYLHLVLRTRHWHVYAVGGATPIVSGAATLRALGPSSLTLDVRHPGKAFVRVRFTPYWALSRGPGCVAPAGNFTSLTLRRPGPVRLIIQFAFDRILARSPRCA